MTPDSAEKDDDGCNDDSDVPFDDHVLPLNDKLDSDGQSPVFGPKQDTDHTLRRRAQTSGTDHARKVSRESIAEFLAHECDCGNDCTAHFSRNQIQPLRDATFDAELTKGGPEHCRCILNGLKQVSPITHTQSFEFTVCNRQVCEAVCCLAHGATASAWKRGKNAAANDLDFVPKKVKSQKNAPYYIEEKSLLGSERAAQTERWCEEFIELHGCQMPDSPLVYLDDIPIVDMCTQCAIDLEDIIKPLTC